MTKLSPAAQAVLDAINKELDEAPWDLTFIAGSAAAAALRAVAKHCVPDDSEGHWVYIPHVLAIAHELEVL